MGRADELRSREEELEKELAETRRLLSAGQLAYHLNWIHELLKGGNPTTALAEFEKPTLKDLMVLHGYAETYRKLAKKERDPK